MPLQRKSDIGVELGVASDRQRKPRVRIKRKTVVWLSICLVVVIGLGYIFIGSDFGYLKLRRLQKENADMEREIQALQEENEALRHDLEDTQAKLEKIEKLAREGLGMSKPDELIFRFIPPEEKQDSTDKPDNK
jgi:cell division protein FtsB